jgi:hypothetical protein
MIDDGVLRTFDTGATRDTAGDKLDYEGFLSPRALRRYAEYMHVHRKQSDGTLRAADNWQKGIPLDAYMKSLWRHFMDVWLAHRLKGRAGEDALCAMLFNVMGYLHEILKPDPRIHPAPGQTLREVFDKEQDVCLPNGITLKALHKSFEESKEESKEEAKEQDNDKTGVLYLYGLDSDELGWPEFSQRYAAMRAANVQCGPISDPPYDGTCRGGGVG